MEAKTQLRLGGGDGVLYGILAPHAQNGEMMTTGVFLNDQQAQQSESPKAVRLVEYLTRLASLRSKIVRDTSSYVKVLWLSDIPHELGCFTRAWEAEDDRDPDIWLEVQNRPEPKCPPFPDQCEIWVNDETRDSNDELPELRQEIERQALNPEWEEGSEEPKTIPVVERLDDHLDVRRAWDCYLKEQWMPWQEKHNSWEGMHQVYTKLFLIHQECLRLGEEYELVLGLGLLSWETPSGQRVRRHLAVANADLMFEASSSTFTVCPDNEGAKLRPELDMLDICDQPPRAEKVATDSLAAAEDDPWDKLNVEAVLQGLVHSIDPSGEYDASPAASRNISAKPVVEYAPALILRKRSTRGLTETLKRMKEQIEQGGAIPRGFADVAESLPDRVREPNDAPQDSQAEFDGEVFFPKASNREQRRIVEKMRQSHGVLVQGPPGTGKSHTIANLICHLLATGQRILITSKTPRALQVLQNHLPEEISPLCITLLGDGKEEQKALEASVSGILRRREEWDKECSEEERKVLEQRLHSLRAEKVELDRRLRAIREAETHSHSVADGTYRGTAAVIAQAVNADRERYGWFTDSAPMGSTCPITTEGIHNILEALRFLTCEKRQELSLAWPESVVPSDHFSELVRNVATASVDEKQASSNMDRRFVDLLMQGGSASVQAIHDAVSRFQEAQRGLAKSPYSWIDDAIIDILCGKAPVWRSLLAVTEQAISTTEGMAAVADENSVDIANGLDIRMVFEDARRLRDHLEAGGRLKSFLLFRPKVVKERGYLLESVTLNGRSCTTAQHFETLAAVLNVRMTFEMLGEHWATQSEKLEGPYRLQLSTIKSWHNALANALAIEDLLAKCRKSVEQCPMLPEPSWHIPSEVASMLSSCRFASAGIRKRIAEAEIRKVETSVARALKNDEAHPITGTLFEAVRDRKVEQYDKVQQELQELEQQRTYAREVDEATSKLREMLPQLVASMKDAPHEPHWAERTEQIHDVWRWAQARYWIEEYIREDDAPAQERRAKQIEKEIGDTLAQLASLHAWTRCFSRLKDEHCRHMELWQQCIRRIGKGTGKHASHHRREAQGHLNECREAVPAWVMPLHRVWDTVAASPGMFDVIIVDEASQCGLEAMPLFYLAKKMLIVGDDKQISPDAVGVNRDDVHRSMKEFLHDFRYQSSFDIQSSLFDQGRVRYGLPLTLREHFRCMPEIIRFSNDLSYHDTPLIPLRQYGPDRLPPLEHVFVSGGYREGGGQRVINRQEAEAIAEKIRVMCEDSRYDGKSMGVVVLQGQAQASHIESLLLDKIGAEEMQKRHLVCGDPYSFQGGERHIMFLSLVAASNARIGAFTKKADERRFNVAASRARDMMILFHSVTREDLSPNCLRRRLLEFFEDTRPQTINGIEREDLERHAARSSRRMGDQPEPFDSWFEVDVALELLRRHFHVVAQYQFAGKRIDLVVGKGQVQLAVECDGDAFHGPDRYEADMARQRQLERCNWNFVRVRASTFYTNREEALAELWRTLDDLGIKANAQTEEQGEAPTSTLEQDVDAAIGQEDHVLSEGDDEADGVVHDDIFDDEGFDDEIFGDDASEDDEADDEDASDFDPEFPLFRDPRPLSPAPPRRSQEVKAAEIRATILHVLANRPNQSCTLDSLSKFVLRELGINTRGAPRKKFDQRTRRSAKTLEKSGDLEIYWSKNQRVRLITNRNRK